MRPVQTPDPTKRALSVLPDNPTANDIKRSRELNERMAVIPHARESFAERQTRLQEEAAAEGRQRLPYASMLTHMETAAIALASGSTFREAAAKAGISVRQVKKYYEDADFRKRIDELRAVMFSKIRGRIVKEMEKRTGPGVIGDIELLDLLRIMDRVYGAPGGKGGAGVHIAGDVNVGGTHYDTLIQALLTQKPGGESTDFLIYEPESLPASSDGAPE